MIDLDFLKDHDRLVALDAETTGRPMMTPAEIAKAPKGLRIPGIVIELGCVEMLRDGASWTKGRTWMIRTNPDGPINPQAIKVHGIKPADLAKAPRFPDVIDELTAFLGDSPLVAHAYLNEKKFLDYEAARAKRINWGEEWFPDERYICTQEIYAELFPGAPKSLDAMVDRLWLDRTARFDHHGALLDADFTADAFNELTRILREGGEDPTVRSVAVD